MSAGWLAAASALFMSGAYLSFEGMVREHARRHAAGSAGESRVSSTLARSGALDWLDNVVVQSKPGTTAMIDHVVLIPGCLVVVETKNWNGVITGDSRSEQWLQVRPDGAQQVHRNPLSQAKRQARILARATGVPTSWMVVMAGRCRHSSGSYPAGMIDLDALVQTLADQGADQGAVAGLDKPALPPDMTLAWQGLSALAADPGAAQRTRALGQEAYRRYGRREWLGWTAMAIAAAGAATGQHFMGLVP